MRISDWSSDVCSSDLSDSIIVVMSTLVFAGAAQFAALDLWGTQIPLFTLMVAVFAINARHLLMGATLYPWLRKLPPAKRYGVKIGRASCRERVCQYV